MDRAGTGIAVLAVVVAIAGFVTWLLAMQSKFHDMEEGLDRRADLVEWHTERLCWWLAEELGEPVFGCEINNERAKGEP